MGSKPHTIKIKVESTINKGSKFHFKVGQDNSDFRRLLIYSILS